MTDLTPGRVGGAEWTGGGAEQDKTCKVAHVQVIWEEGYVAGFPSGNTVNSEPRNELDTVVI